MNLVKDALYKRQESDKPPNDFVRNVSVVVVIIAIIVAVFGPNIDQGWLQSPSHSAKIMFARIYCNSVYKKPPQSVDEVREKLTDAGLQLADGITVKNGKKWPVITFTVLLNQRKNFQARQIKVKCVCDHNAPGTPFKWSAPEYPRRVLR